MASNEGMINVGKVLIDILAIAIKARLGFYGKNPLAAIADIKKLVDSVMDASDSIKKDLKDDIEDADNKEIKQQ